MKRLLCHPVYLLLAVAAAGVGCAQAGPAAGPATTDGQTGETAPTGAPLPAPEIVRSARTLELGVLPSACGELLADPVLLIELSEAAWKDHNPELGYRYAALVRQMHPKSPQVAMAWELTAPALAHMSRPVRRDPTSKWTTSEPVFLFEWLAQIYRDSGDVFPADEANMLFSGLSKELRKVYERYADGHPELSRWPLRFKMENGFVEYVAPVEAPAQAP